MTDGEFNLSYFDASSVDEVYNDAGKEPTRTAAKTLCAAMRDKGIEIFTIGFDLTENATPGDLEGLCQPDTGSIKHFYQACHAVPNSTMPSRPLPATSSGLALTK